MAMSMTMPIVSAHDREVLRRLAAHVGDLWASPDQTEKRRLWNKFNRLEMERPMLLTECGQGVLDSDLECEGAWARGAERWWRDNIYHADVAKDDYLVAPRATYGHVVHCSGYGVEVIKHQGNDGEGHGSYTWDAPIQDLSQDLAKLKFREWTYDPAATEAQRELMESIYGGVLPVVRRSDYWWTMGMTWPAIDLMGLEAFMMAMYDDPDGLHALMAFLRDEHLHALTVLETGGLLTLNNDEGFVGSGGMGYFDLLPQEGFDSANGARVKDLWGLSESQETVSVSTEMFAEFVFPYQVPVIERFGLSSYGCCEPLDKRFQIVKQIANLRRVSVSPWANPHVMAEQIGSDYIFSSKPNPSYVATTWDEGVIYEELRNILTATKANNCVVELTLKDVSTVNNEPWRIARWIAMAREVVDEVYG